jgi:hypothetical protein
MEAQQS